jgi:hypothetical protein
MNSVAGSPGTKMPTIPSATQSTPSEAKTPRLISILPTPMAMTSSNDHRSDE